MARGRQPRSEETIRFILDATDQLLLREGPAAVTTKRVAETAGVGVGTLYHHFEDRAALLKASERRAWSAEAERLLAELPPVSPDTVDDVLRHMVAFTIESAIRRMDSHGITMDDPDLRAAMFDIWDHTVRLMITVLQPVSSRLRRPDLTTSLHVVTETLSLMSWMAALRHRDMVASGVLQREIADMIARYLMTDP